MLETNKKELTSIQEESIEKMGTMQTEEIEQLRKSGQLAHNEHSKFMSF